MIDAANNKANEPRFFRLKRVGGAPKCRKARVPAGVVIHRADSRSKQTAEAPKHVADLYSLGFLLTGCRDLSMATDSTVSQDDDNPFFTAWMQAWSRRNVIARATAAIREQLAESARRTELAEMRQTPVAPRDWSLRTDTTRAQIEEALLAIDVFPRAAVLLLIFEGVRITDAATLLDADAALVRKAQAIGLYEFTANLAGDADGGDDGFSRHRG